MKVITDAGLRPRVCGLSLAIAELVRGSRAAVTGGAILASALAIVPAVAQEQAEDDQVLEEVVVTGSRIVRQDFTANSPIQTVDETLFEETSAIGVETVLNRLPQFVPAVTQFSTGDVQQTVTNTVGASTVSLRGLGPNRNLVLINGMRAMPVDPRMVVDTNSIPSAGDSTRRGHLGRRFGRVRRGRRRRRRQLHPQGRLRGRQHRRPLRRHGARRRPDGDGLGALRRQRGRRPRQRHARHRARHAVEAADARQRDWRIDGSREPEHGRRRLRLRQRDLVPQRAGRRQAESELPSRRAGERRSTRASSRPTTFRTRRSIRPGRTSATNNTTIGQQPDAGRRRRDLPPATSACRTLVHWIQTWAIPRWPLRPLDDNPASMPDAEHSGRRELRAVPHQPGRHGFLGFGGRRRCSLPALIASTGPCTTTRRTRKAATSTAASQGLPAFVMQPNGQIKENVLYNWASIPLERLSAFANGHFDVADNVRVTGQAMVTRTKTETSLGLDGRQHQPVGRGRTVRQPDLPRQHEYLLRHPRFAGRRQRQRRCRRRRPDARVLHAERPIRRELRCGRRNRGNAVGRRPAGLHELGGLADLARKSTIS